MGFYAAKSRYHGFLRNPDGTFTKFDVPGSVGTIARSINPAGEIAGFYLFGANPAHGGGFLRIPCGAAE